MARKDKLKHVSFTEIDGLLDQARAENWSQLALVGPGFQLSARVENWPDSLKTASRVFRLSASPEGLAGKLHSLPGLTSLNMG